MEENENSLKQLKDQINSLKPQPIDNLDLADYNAYQFSRSIKNLHQNIKSNETIGRQLLRPKQKEELPRVSNTRDVSYRKDILPTAHHRVCSRGELTEAIKNKKFQTMTIGFGTSYSKHRRTGSQSVANSKNVNEPQSFPTDIKHLEKLVKFTGANHRNLSGGKTCTRESCLNHNALLSNKIQSPWNTEKSNKEIFDEENLMHQLEVFYKKNTDFTYSIVKKSALESNMFSDRRITFEGMLKAKSDKDLRNKLIDDPEMRQGFSDISQKPNTDHKKDEINIFALLQQVDLKNARKNDLGEPTGRREVELLNQWLDSMLNTHVFSKGDLKKDPEMRKQALYHAKLILSVCLRDLIRQVSVQCLERGVLIEKVLNNYINIFETETRGNMYDLNELQAKHLKDILKIKSEAVKKSHLESRSKELETALRERIQQLEDNLGM